MPLDARLVEIVRLLQKATDRGTIRWTTTSQENTFRATLSSSLVRIAREEEPFNQSSSLPTYQLVVLDQRNQPIEEFRSSEAEGTALLDNLFQKVRAKAINLDHAWDLFVSELRQRAEK
jgi:hypothetical protein